MRGTQPKKRTKRKPRDIAQAIIQDRLEWMEDTIKLGHPLTEDESQFAISAYKAFGEADQIDAEVEYLTALSPKESEKLEDLLAEIEEAQEGPNIN